MPRKLRLEYAGAIYHVMNRRDRRGKIFRGKQNREIFLRTLAWIAQRLCMSSWTYTANLIYEKRAQRKRINSTD